MSDFQFVKYLLIERDYVILFFMKCFAQSFIHKRAE